MKKVTIWIGAKASKYWALLEFTDQKNQIHRKYIEENRKSTQNSNLLQAIIDAIRTLNCRCLLDIYTDSDYLIGPHKNGWVNRWRENGWKNAKGMVIRNQQQWQSLTHLLADHSYRFITEKADQHRMDPM